MLASLEEHKTILSARDKKLQTAKTMPLPAKLEIEAYEALQKLHSHLVTEHRKSAEILVTKVIIKLSEK